MSSITIKRSESIDTSLKKIQSQVLNQKKTFDASKYCGILEKREEPLEYQSKMRREWNESSR